MAAIPATVADVLAIAENDPIIIDANAVYPTQFALIVDDISLCALVPAHWGEKLSQAHSYLAAHILTLFYNSASVRGAVVSRTLDKLAEAYANTALDDAELGQTPYGRTFLLIQKAVRVRQSKTIAEGNLPPDFSVDDRRII